jgi:uncharacterized protein DUF4345
MSRRLLQVVTAILSLIPIATGIIAMTGIDDPLYAALDLPRSPLLDSNLRFFGGVWLGLCLAMLCLVPSIERQTVLFRALWGAVFLGGIGRALSAAFVGLPRALYRLHSPGDHRSAANYSLAEASGKFLSVQGIGRNFADLSLRWDDGLPTMPQ